MFTFKDSSLPRECVPISLVFRSWEGGGDWRLIYYGDSPEYAADLTKRLQEEKGWTVRMRTAWIPVEQLTEAASPES